MDISTSIDSRSYLHNSNLRLYKRLVGELDEYKYLLSRENQLFQARKEQVQKINNYNKKSRIFECVAGAVVGGAFLFSVYQNLLLQDKKNGIIAKTSIPTLEVQIEDLTEQIEVNDGILEKIEECREFLTKYVPSTVENLSSLEYKTNIDSANKRVELKKIKTQIVDIEHKNSIGEINSEMERYNQLNYGALTGLFGLILCSGYLKARREKLLDKVKDINSKISDNNTNYIFSRYSKLKIKNS